jgi:TRAP-type C4-dicarboxylate transport system permease small subunit
MNDDTCQLEPEGDNIKTDMICVKKGVMFLICGVLFLLFAWAGWNICTDMWNCPDESIKFATPLVAIIFVCVEMALAVIIAGVRNE